VAPRQFLPEGGVRTSELLDTFIEYKPKQEAVLLRALPARILFVLRWPGCGAVTRNSRFASTLN
jgi:hypothetical protein